MIEALVVIGVCLLMLFVGWGLIAAAVQEHHDHVDDL